MKVAAESVRIGGELVFLERQIGEARQAVAQNTQPPRHEWPYQVEARHTAMLAMYARTLLREWLEGKPPEISTWVACSPDEPLTVRRIKVVAAVQHFMARWADDKAAGKPLPPVHDAAKFGDMIMDELDKQQQGR